MMYEVHHDRHESENTYTGSQLTDIVNGLSRSRSSVVLVEDHCNTPVEAPGRSNAETSPGFLPKTRSTCHQAGIDTVNVENRYPIYSSRCNKKKAEPECQTCHGKILCARYSNARAQAGLGLLHDYPNSYKEIDNLFNPNRVGYNLIEFKIKKEIEKAIEKANGQPRVIAVCVGGSHCKNLLPQLREWGFSKSRWVVFDKALEPGTRLHNYNELRDKPINMKAVFQAAPKLRPILRKSVRKAPPESGRRRVAPEAPHAPEQPQVCDTTIQTDQPAPHAPRPADNPRQHGLTDVYKVCITAVVTGAAIFIGQKIWQWWNNK